MNTNNKEIETFINNLKLIKQGEDDYSKFSIYKSLKGLEVTLVLDNIDIAILYVYGKRHELKYENGLQATLESNWDYIKQLGILH